MLKGNVQQNVIQNWDKNGNIFYTDEFRNPLENNNSILNAVSAKLKALGTNIQRRINNPINEEYNNDANLALSLATMPIGAGAKITSSIASPLVPYFGKQISKNIAQGIGAGGLSGAVEGFGQGLLNDENPFIKAVSNSIIGGLSGGTLGLGVGKVGKSIARGKLVNNPVNQKNYIKNYIEGLSDNAEYVGKSSRLGKELADYRGAKQGRYNLHSGRAFEFAGENSKTANLERLKYAKKYIAEGHDPNQIRKDFGWFQGVDGKWRYEIPSGEMKPYTLSKDFIKNGYEKLKNIYDNKEIFDAYPRLENTRIYIRPFTKEDGDFLGYSTPGKNQIHLNSDLLLDKFEKSPEYIEVENSIKKIENTKEFKDYEKAKQIHKEYLRDFDSKKEDKAKNAFYSMLEFENSKIGKQYANLRNRLSRTKNSTFYWNEDAKRTLPHEIQHIIQKKEGFDEGGDTTIPNLQEYLSYPGEQEAEVVSKRTFYTPEQRAEINPMEQFGIPIEEQIKFIKKKQNNISL